MCRGNWMKLTDQKMPIWRNMLWGFFAAFWQVREKAIIDKEQYFAILKKNIKQIGGKLYLGHYQTFQNEKNQKCTARIIWEIIRCQQYIPRIILTETTLKILYVYLKKNIGGTWRYRVECREKNTCLWV